LARVLKLDAGLARGLAGRDRQIVDAAFGVSFGAVGDGLGLRGRMIEARGGLVGGVLSVCGDTAVFRPVATRQSAR
jgi:hypothetical protein